MSIFEDYDHPHLRGEAEWFRWLFGAFLFNVDKGRKMISSGEVKAELHTVPVKDCYALLGLDENEFGSQDFTNDWESGRGINPMSGIQQRNQMKGMPDEKLYEPAMIVMFNSADAMRRIGLPFEKKHEAENSKLSPVLIDGNHRLGRLFLEGAESAQVYVIPYEESLKFCYDRYQHPIKI